MRGNLIDNSFLFYACVEAFLYFTGSYINLKMISACWKQKEGNTWRIHMFHSISLIIYYTFYIPFSRVTHVIPNLAGEYTGEWICYVALFIITYAFAILSQNSLLVAVMKYIFIVHSIKALTYGNDRIKRLFFIIGLAVPISFAIFACLTKDYESFAVVHSCFGQTEQVLKQYDTWEKTFERIFLCNLNEDGNSPSQESIFYIVKQVLCVIRSTITTITNSNVPETFFYYKLFRTMNR